jgi:hypothetical protein
MPAKTTLQKVWRAAGETAAIVARALCAIFALIVPDHRNRRGKSR